MFALGPRLRVMAKGGFYAVAVGRAPGVYHDWTACDEQVRKYSGAVYKKFATYEQAETFVAHHRSGGAPAAAAYGAPPAHEYHSSSSSSAAMPAQQYASDGGGSHYIRLTGSNKWAPPAAEDCFLLRFDGGSRGNPGVAGCGAVIWAPVPLDGGDRVRVWERGTYLGPRRTNNEGEWTALVDGLRAATRLGITCLVVEGDSELVVKQFTGSYECRAPNLQGFLADARRLVSGGHGWRYLGIRHILRAGNAAADALANRAMDTCASCEWYAPADELAALRLHTVHESGGGGGGGSGVGQKRGRDGDDYGGGGGPPQQHPRYDDDYYDPHGGGGYNGYPI